MLNLTRVSTVPDVGRMADALSHAGIDPRSWFAYAIVDAVGVDEEGAFVDVSVMPLGYPGTARVAQIYAGPGFGFYVPIAIDDEVVVGYPNGDPGHGLTVLARMQSMSDQLPDDAMTFQNDLVLVVKDGQSLRIGVSGGGKVFLGSTTAEDAAVRGTTYRSAEDSRFEAMDTLAEALAAAIAALSAAAPVLTDSPAIPAWTAAVTAVSVALTAYTSAVASFAAGAPTYLSETVAVGP